MLNKRYVFCIELSAVLILILLSNVASLFAADLKMFNDVRLIADPSNDGDSFIV